MTQNAYASPHPLAFVRAQRGWTYQKLARVVARRAQDLGEANMAVERQKVWRWEHRGVIPDRVSQLALATELGVPGERLASHPWPSWLPAGDLVRTDYPWTQEGSLLALTNVVQEALTDFRGFMTLTGSGLTALAEQWRRLKPARLTGTEDGGQVDEQVLRRIARSIPGLRGTDDRLGGASVRRLVDAELGLVADLLSRGATASTSRELYLLAAELARLAGWVSFDAGYNTAAQRYWVCALYAAHAGGDRLLGAGVLTNMALQCLDFSRPAAALQLARTAADTAGEVTGRAGAMLRLHTARAHAALGDEASCLHEIGDAEDSFSLERSPDGPAWASWFDRAELWAQIGCCYLDLGHLRSADRWLDQALDAQGAHKSRDRATYLLRRAAVQIDLGNVDTACALAAQAVPFLAVARSGRNARHTGEIRRRLRDCPSTPVTRDLDEQLAEIMKLHAG